MARIATSSRGALSTPGTVSSVRKVIHVGVTAHGAPGMHGVPLTSYSTNRRVSDTLRSATVDPWKSQAVARSGLSHRMVVADTHYVATAKTAKAMANQQRALQSRGLRKLAGRT